MEKAQTTIGQRSRLLPIDHDPSNGACYITIIWITYQGALDNQYEDLNEICFANVHEALAYYAPQIRGEWKLDPSKGYEADLKRNCAFNLKGNAALAIRIRTGTLLLNVEEATQDELVAEDR